MTSRSDTVADAYRDLLTSTRAYKAERDTATAALDRLACAVDRYLHSTEAEHAERLEQLDDALRGARQVLDQPRHDDDPDVEP